MLKIPTVKLGQGKQTVKHEKNTKHLQLCMYIVLLVRWKEDFKYERLGTASDKVYVSKFLDEV